MEGLYEKKVAVPVSEDPTSARTEQSASALRLGTLLMLTSVLALVDANGQTPSFEVYAHPIYPRAVSTYSSVSYVTWNGEAARWSSSPRGVETFGVLAVYDIGVAPKSARESSRRLRHCPCLHDQGSMAFQQELGQPQ